MRFDFYYSVSIIVGAGLALISALWKSMWINYKDNYIPFLQSYIKENYYHLTATDIEIINEKIKK